MKNITFRSATAADWPAVSRLLTQAELPVAGAEAHLNHFLLAFRDEELVASAGLEIYGTSALLRSVAVSAREQGKGLGKELVRRLLDQAGQAGVRQVALLTTTADHFFPRFGFATVSRADLSAELFASAEFQGVCPSSSTIMRLDLGGKHMEADATRTAVRNRYAQTAQGSSGCCAPAADPAYGACCGGTTSADDLAKSIGYSEDDLSVVPSGANLGLGCGNPQAIAAIRPGETVLDLGSGAGFDCFLAARQVGAEGRVIGVDMTPEMLAKARANARTGGWQNVEFRLGEIEHLPVADQSVDVIISNCVINLSPEKHLVFREAFRVLKPGGRLAVSDMVASTALPPDVQQDLALYAGCIAGAATIGALETMLAEAGFTDISITPKDSRQLLQTWGADTKLEDVVFSANIQAVRA